MSRLLAWVSAGVVLLAGLRAEARLLDGVNVAALAAAGERLYVGGFDQGLFVVEPGRAPRPLTAPGLSAHINALTWDSSSRALWIGTARGLVRCRHEQALSCQRIGPSRGVHALLVREGGELVAGGDDGLLFVRGGEWRALGKKQRAPFRAVWALAESAGVLFVGATNGLFWGAIGEFRPGAALARASVVQGSLPDDWVTALLVRGDALYVGTYNAGVSRFAVLGGALSERERAPELGHVNPAGLVALPGGELAVCSMEGLWRGRTMTHTEDVTALAETPSRNGAWLGTRRGLELVQGGAFSGGVRP